MMSTRLNKPVQLSESTHARFRDRLVKKKLKNGDALVTNLLDETEEVKEVQQ